MNRVVLISALFASLSLVACDRDTVISVPTPALTPVAVPGPAGPSGATGATGATGASGGQGATGSTGDQGKTGETGKTGDGGTVIVLPPASEPAK